MKRLLRIVGSVPFRFMPSAARRRLVQVIIHGAAGQAPRVGMRDLLDIDTDVPGLINEVALQFDEGSGVHVKHRLMRYHDFFVDRIGTGERVLDIGCGYGAVAHSVATRSGADVTGIDFEPDNIAKAQRWFPKARFVVGMAPQDLPDEPFDVVMASNVLDHVADRVGFLRTVQQKVRPARWLIRVPMFDRDWRVPMRRELGMWYFGDPTHFIEYTRESFEQEIAAAGFVVRHLQVNWGEIWAEVASVPPAARVGASSVEEARP